MFQEALRTHRYRGSWSDRNFRFFFATVKKYYLILELLVLDQRSKTFLAIYNRFFFTFKQCCGWMVMVTLWISGIGDIIGDIEDLWTIGHVGIS